MQTLNCFLPYISPDQVMSILLELNKSGVVGKIYLMTSDPDAQTIPGCEILSVDSLTSTQTLRKMSEHISQTEWGLIYTSYASFSFVQFGLQRMLSIAQNTYCQMAYADHYVTRNNRQQEMPLIDYQAGSLRDDFNFGPLLLIEGKHLKNYFAYKREDYTYAGFYHFRLSIAPTSMFHIREYLYTVADVDDRKSGEKIFDYVDPKNRVVQLEMEAACTAHLKEVGALITDKPLSVNVKEKGFPYEASVIIPVRNRARTIEDAIRSVLMQETSFKYNLIIIDNHSTDGTTEIIDRYASDPRLIHLIPEEQNLGIGGCWNLGIHHPQCGKFAVQLDSDDLYSGPDTLQKIVDAFYAEQCAMVIGTYKMTDFDLNEIPPGVIDHKEWTPQNGRNNALRINGLGAPRAFFTPVLREINMPNVSYGEDYAVGLRISRIYRIGRIYDVLYYCRRWEDNSDAALDVRKMNEYNMYKDALRTWELQARININKKRDE